MGLNSDKTSKVFCINICRFSTRFYFLYQNGSHPSFIKIVHVWISTPHKSERSVYGYVTFMSEVKSEYRNLWYF